MAHRKGMETQEEWCRRTFHHVDGECGQVTRWVLKGQASAGGGVRTFATVQRPGNVPELMQAIDREATGSRMRQVSVHAFQSKAKHQVSQRRWAFEQEDDEEPSLDGGAGFHGGMSAVHIAHLKEMHRHNERLRESWQLGARETIQMLATELQQTRQRLAELEGRELEVFKLLQDLEDRRVDRELKTVREVTMAKGMDAAVAMIQHKFLGGAVPEGEQGRALAEAITALGESFSPEELAGLRGQMRPEQQLAMAHLFEVAEKALEDGGEGEGEEEEEEEEAVLEPGELRKLKAAMEPEVYGCALKLLKEDRGLLEDPLDLMAQARQAKSLAEAKEAKPQAKRKAKTKSVAEDAKPQTKPRGRAKRTGKAARTSRATKERGGTRSKSAKARKPRAPKAS